MAKSKISSKQKSSRKPKPKPIYIGDDNVFEVDNILAHRKSGRRTEYLVKWTGYDETENSWVKKHDVTPDLIELFHNAQASLTPQAMGLETSPVQVSVIGNASVGDSYFEDGFNSLGANVELLSATTDFRLFPSPGKSMNQAK